MYMYIAPQHYINAHAVDDYGVVVEFQELELVLIEISTYMY